MSNDKKGKLPSKSLGLAKKLKSSSHKESDFVISRPLADAVHKVHVDTEYNWGDQGASLFDLGELLGEGAYGSVFQGTHKESGAVIAIKSCRNLGAAKNTVGKEINILKKCKHKNIVQYYGSAIHGREFWILMEYCGGGALNDLMEKLPEKHLSEPLIRAAMAASVEGLIYLHENAIIHRDVKAANIILTERGEVKLADFGVSAQMGGDVPDKKKTVTGTPLWMSPEVLNGEGKYDSKTDQWSLGITAIELAEGQPPYSDENVMQAMMKICSKDSPKPGLTKEPEKWSDDFKAFIDVCVEREPEKRPTAVDLAKHSFIAGHAKTATEVMAEFLKKLGKYKEGGMEKEIIRETEKKKEVEQISEKLQGSMLGSLADLNVSDQMVKEVVEEKQTETLKMLLQTKKAELDKAEEEHSSLKKKVDAEKKKAKKVKSKIKAKKAENVEPVETELDKEIKGMSRADLVKKIKLLDATYRATLATNAQTAATIQLLSKQLAELQATVVAPPVPKRNKN
eukprot:TRINITY_DN1827_c0_g3_i1.p1 TRINITY_DN1827_c0_g3~~TRINITY_DN1827_c0_g3_i1.p1  ORF type:complete len:523 (-),score=140.20 TRINITY_DN1827_c0_g3_i1:19-1551(-)